MNFPIDLFRETPTPFYYYDLKLLRRTLAALKNALPDADYRVHYAMKANADPLVLDEIRRAGLGIDAVSGGEVQRALDCGFDPAKIVFAGVGKTDAEITLALQAGIACFNVESLPEMEVINAIASSLGLTADIALRVNPEIDAHTHSYITTGLAENKFGINLGQLPEVVAAAQAMPAIRLTGLHFHIGSQLTENEPFRLLCERINTLQDQFEANGVRFQTINVGGGLGVDYANPDAHPVPDFAGYFSTFAANLRLRPGQQLHFELGRAIVCQCGSLITRVVYVKEGTVKKFVIVDAGMTDLIRPALYQAHHLIQNLTSTGPAERYDVVGPICESSDVFDKDITLPLTRRGDILALRSAGAYGQIMASRYNLRQIPPTVVDADEECQA